MSPRARRGVRGGGGRPPPQIPFPLRRARNNSAGRFLCPPVASPCHPERGEGSEGWEAFTLGEVSLLQRLTLHQPVQLLQHLPVHLDAEIVHGGDGFPGGPVHHAYLNHAPDQPRLVVHRGEQVLSRQE